MHAPLSVK